MTMRTLLRAPSANDYLQRNALVKRGLQADQLELLQGAVENQLSILIDRVPKVQARHNLGAVTLTS